MASTSSMSFEGSLDQFRDYLSKDQKQQFNAANLSDLNATIQEIQATLGREQRLCNFRRIEKFLDAMKHVEQLVSIFLNVHEVVAFVWGPIKLALMAATTWANSIKQLLDSYEEIGEALSNLAFFHALIKSKGAEHLRQALEDYFSDILRFHRCVLDVFSRPNGKPFFRAAWGSFRRQVEPILRALKLRQEKLSHERLQAHAIHEGVRDFREHADGRFDKLAADLDSIRSTLESESLRRQTSSEDQDMKEFLEDKLNLSRFRSHRRLDSLELSPASGGDWIFHHPDFQAWERATSSERSVLFLNGSPGAGKTTLAMKVTRHLKSKNSSRDSTVYFFFRHDDEHRKSAKPMLRAILSQLIQQDKIIMRYLYEKCASMSHNLELSSLATLQDLAQDCLTSQTSASVVLDGLDECAENEPNAIITWFLEKVLPPAASQGCHLKLLVCGQRDGRLDQLLSKQPQIRLDTVEFHQRDIEEYSRSQAVEICTRFSQTPEQAKELAAKVAKTSQGMFLYAKVVMSNFLSMDSTDEFEDEMEEETFPEDLDKAYERIVQRILGDSKQSRQRTVKKILGWLICCQRPLRWREIQSSFCIDAERGTCNAKRRRVDSCKKICGSLVDITTCDLFETFQSEEIVHMVHETAGKYLVQRGIINLLQEHANMALFCCRYLSSEPFLQDLETANGQNTLQSGYFGLLDYATVHYSGHIQEAQKDAFGLPSDVGRSAKDLLMAYSGNPSNETILKMEACTQAVTNALRAEKIDILIQARVVAIRAAMESRHHNLSKENAYLDLSGPLRFKCPRVFCSNFTNGFRYQRDRDGHLEKHERPYRCTYTDCPLLDLGYESFKRLKAHCEAFHQDTMKLPVAFPSARDTEPKNIFEACEQGNLEQVKKFHLAGAQLDESLTKEHITPLYLATQGSHAKVCEYLVSQGIKPVKGTTYTQQTMSPMFTAIRQGDVPLTELFLHTRRDFRDETIISQYPRCIAIAILADHLGTLETLLGSQHCPDHAAIVEDVLEELLNPFKFETWPVEPPADSSLVHTWFRRAFPNLYHGEISVPGKNCLIKKPDSAAYCTCHEILLQSDNRFLHRALAEKCNPLSMFLLDFADEHDLQSSDEHGRLPMHNAILRHCKERDCENCPVIVERIIEIGGGAAVNTPNKDGSLPIHKALACGALARGNIATRSVRALISHTNNLNHKDYQGRSPIFNARMPTHISMLLAAGDIDLFITNNQGQTAFSSASGDSFATAKTLEVLLEADPTLAWAPNVTQVRKTPLHHIMASMARKTPLALARQDEKAVFLLSPPTVEHVLREFSASPAEGNASACERVREFARKKGLEGAIEVMDRIGFGL